MSMKLKTFSGCDVGEEHWAIFVRSPMLKDQGDAEKLVLQGLLQKGKLEEGYQYYSLTTAGKARLRKQCPDTNP